MNAAPPGALQRVGAVIVHYHAGDWLARALDALRPADSDAPAVIIVDNGSEGEDLESLATRPGVSVDRPGRNLGFASGVNRGAARLDAELLLILNPDCLLEPGDLLRLVAELDAHPEAALVSGRVVDADGREQRASRRVLPTPRRVAREMLGRPGGIDRSDGPAPEESVEVEAVSGACMLVRSAIFRELGGLDEDYPMHFEDLDLFARIRAAGRSLRWIPDVRIVHAGGVSSARRPAAVAWAKHRGLLRYLRRHCLHGRRAWQLPMLAIPILAHGAWASARAALGARR